MVNNKSIRLLIIFVITIITSSFSVIAEGSCVNDAFMGTCQFIRNSGTVNCTVGTTINAYINYATDQTADTTPGIYTTLFSGIYGNKLSNGYPNLLVIVTLSTEGQPINFTINGINADQTSTTSTCADLLLPEDLALTITDTSLPKVETISKSNNSYINNTDRLTITVSDNKGINNLSFNNGNGSNVSFSNNTAFNPLFTSQGNNYIDIILTDRIGNINVTTYNYSFDNVTPHFSDIGPSGSQSTTASSLHVILWTTTNEQGNCTYGTTNSSFGALTQMNSSNGLNHTANLSFSADASSTAYYFKCNDTAGNINVDGNTTSFSVDVSSGDTGGGTGGGGGGGGGTTPAATPSAPVSAPITSPSVPSSEGEGAEAGAAGAAEGGAESSAPAGEGGEGAEAGAPSEAPVTAGEGEEEGVGLAGMAFKGLTENLAKTTEALGKAFSSLKTKKGAQVFSLIIILLLITFLIIIIKKTKKKN